MAEPPNHCTFCTKGYFKSVGPGSFILECDQCSKQAWWCKWCHLTNSAEAQSCELCSAISPQRASELHSEKEGWDCSRCAARNSACSPGQLDLPGCKECGAYSSEACENLEQDLIAHAAELGRLQRRADDVVRKSAIAGQGNSPGPELDQGNSNLFVLMIDVADFLQHVQTQIPGGSYRCSFKLLLQFGNLQKQAEKLCTDLRLKSAIDCPRHNETQNGRSIPRTQAAIIEYLIESAETEESAALIFQHMLAKDLLLELNDGIIMVRAIDNFRHAMRLRFANQILAGFPNWGMTQGQKTVLLNNILKMTPLATLMSEDLQEAVYDRALISAMSNDPASFPNAVNILLPSFRRRLHAAFPGWDLSIKQNEAIVDHILNTFDLEHVLALASSTIEQSIWLSALESASQANATDFHPEHFAVVLKYLVSPKFEQAFPPWPLTDFQKTAVIDRIFKMQPARDLGRGPDWQMFADALESEASHGALTCPICMEPMVSLADEELDTSNMWFAPQRKTEHWRSQPCGHACCRECITMWAETVIDEHKTSVKCPVDGCSYRLWDQDLKELLDKSALRRHKEHVNGNYLKHLKLSVQKDKTLSKWLKDHAVPCPDCHVIVSRSEGCDVMICVCGTKFCYRCGFKKCRCKERKENRPDIWKPQK